MLTAGVMTCGGIEFKTKGRDDQAECEDISEASFPGGISAIDTKSIPNQQNVERNTMCINSMYNIYIMCGKLQEKPPAHSRFLLQR